MKPTTIPGTMGSESMMPSRILCPLPRISGEIPVVHLNRIIIAVSR